MFKKLFLISILLMSASAFSVEKKVDEDLREFASSFLTSVFDNFKGHRNKLERGKNAVEIVRTYFDEETFDMDEMFEAIKSTELDKIKSKTKRVLYQVSSLTWISRESSKEGATNLVVENPVTWKSIMNNDRSVYALTGYIQVLGNPALDKSLRPHLNLQIVKRKSGYKISDISVNMVSLLFN